MMYMNLHIIRYLFHKLSVLVIGFSVVFIFLRVNDILPVKVLFHELGGLPWLYSVIGLIFSVISAFTIQTQRENWDRLVRGVKGEVTGLRQLHLLTHHVPKDLADRITRLMKTYINLVIHEGWQKAEQGEQSLEVSKTIHDLQEAVFDIAEKIPHMATPAYSLFANILDNRENRVLHSSSHLPVLLRFFINIATAMIILLSIFIGVENIWLDYIFTVSLAILVYLIYIVIEDLDHPLRPGNWHLSNIDYKKLLEEIDGHTVPLDV